MGKLHLDINIVAFNMGTVTYCTEKEQMVLAKILLGTSFVLAALSPRDWFLFLLPSLDPRPIGVLVGPAARLSRSFFVVRFCHSTCTNGVRQIASSSSNLPLTPRPLATSLNLFPLAFLSSTYTLVQCNYFGATPRKWLSYVAPTQPSRYSHRNISLTCARTAKFSMESLLHSLFLFPTIFSPFCFSTSTKIVCFGFTISA